MSYRNIFKNAEQESEFRKNGFFKIQLLSPEEVVAVLRVFNSLNPGISNQFYSTIDSNNLDYRRKVDEQIGQLIGQRVTDCFIDYTPLIFNFIVKKPGGDSEVRLHVDDTHVDESKYQSVNIWCPLVDTTKDNGALYVLPGSHQFYYPPRGFGIPYPYSEFHEVVKPRMIIVPLKAGEAVFYNNKLMHCSESNRTNQIRPAIITGVLPNEAPKIVHFRTSDMGEDKVEVFELSKDFYLSFDRTKRPEGFRSLGIVDYKPVKPTVKEFEKMINGLNRTPRKTIKEKLKSLLSKQKV